MEQKDFHYHGARIVVHREGMNEVEATIYHDKDDIEFTRGTYSRVAYNQMLDKIRDRVNGNGKLKGLEVSR